ncbi:UPF0716 protein FxsA [Sinosporangium album]|uniref:UPF0716 protein FxsA n=1 Tax=Sinosporangium album TaxID=504805 RepID=A0A1G8DNX9_9ACTN|nr:FxsA family protein [Sinosporangium album]SDH59367.1 UPF0716 protein FxsA [Sinosporangium album]
MRLLMFLGFLVVPVLEIWLLIQIGEVIGGWTTVGLLLAASLFGAWLVRREGAKVWRGINEAFSAGRMPERELADGVLVVAGGTLLLTPGFLTDIAGFACVLPFTRPLMRKAFTGLFTRRLRKMAASPRYSGVGLSDMGVNGMPGPVGPAGPSGFGGLGDPVSRPSGPVIHGEVLDEDRKPS